MAGTSNQVSAPLRLYLLGSFRIERGARTLRLSTHKAESLLGYLALHPEKHSREKLAALLWGDVTDEQARHSLRSALSALRKALGVEVILTDRETAQLNLDFPLSVDARELERIEDRGWKIEDGESILALYRGDLLTDFSDDWILPERERLRALYLSALLRIVQQLRANSQYVQAIEWAQRVLAADPANERAHQHLMFCYLAIGERSAALKQYEACRRILREELNAEPSAETTALYERIKQELAGGTAQEAVLTNLPMPLTSFIGRRQELAELKKLISGEWRVTKGELNRPVARHSPLVTLTGAGGSGKTRLAIQVATELVEEFRFLNGAWWVDLSGLSDPALVPQAVATALGLRESPGVPITTALTNFLRAKELLLVLDNCEHLIDACARLADELLSACPKLQILATSREALGITGEVVWRVPTLAMPDPAHLPPLDKLTQYDAVRLFAERATAVLTNWRLAEHAAPVARICARLDGIPLAIELAAARLQALSAQQIAARLDDRFQLLTSGSRTALARQQTLRATMDWSYELLSEPERILFRRLAVFAGGFTLDAAESICSWYHLKRNEVLDVLGRLVDKSLVIVEQESSAETHYRLLETIRQYAHEKLLASSEAERFKERHSQYFVRLADEADRELRGPHQLEWLSRLRMLRDNLRAALEWLIETRQTAPALQLARHLSWFWFIGSEFSEAREWFRRVLELPTTHDYPIAYAAVLTELAHHIWLQSGHAEARPVVEQALSMARAHADKPITARALMILGLVLNHEHNYAAARALLEESKTLFQELQDEWGVGHALLCLGTGASLQGDDASVLAFDEQALHYFQKVGDRFFQSVTLRDIGVASVNQGDFVRARAALRDALCLTQELGSKYELGAVLWSFAYAAQRAGQHVRAIRLYASLQTIFDSLAAWSNGNSLVVDQELAASRAALDESAFASAWVHGRAMTLEQVIEYALESMKTDA